MSVNATPAVQVTLSGPSLDAPSAPPLETGNIPLYCPNGATGQAATLPAATAGLPLNFPVGVTNAVFIFIAADTTTDLIVTVNGVQLPVPQGQGLMLYGLPSSQVSLGSVLGGQVATQWEADMDITKAEVDALFLPGRVVAVEYLKPDATADLIRTGEEDPASHALCCLGGLDIVEASATGVIESNLRNYLRGNCRLTVREASPAPTAEQAEKATDFWLARVGDPYSWGMIFGSIPVMLASKVIGLFSKRLADQAVRKMPNLLASSTLSTCAELGARGLREFTLTAFRSCDVEDVTPAILRTDDSLTTVDVLDGAVFVD